MVISTKMPLPGYSMEIRCTMPQLLKCSFCRKRLFVHINFKTLGWSIRSSSDGGGLFDSGTETNDTDSGTRLNRAIRAIRINLSSKVKEIRKHLATKLLFFLVGFYCATAFATVIGQTGDWDILSAALAVVIVEGVGALMYKDSVPLLNKVRRLISMFNYWKAGLCLGLFLDSFKY